MDSHVREGESLVPSRRQALCLGAALVTVPAGVLALAASSPGIAAAAPANPLQRARAAWLAFAAAMDELASPGDGWMLQGAGARRAAHGRPAEAWVSASRLAYEWEAFPAPGFASTLVERREPLDLLPGSHGDAPASPAAWAPDPIFARIAAHKRLMEPVRTCPTTTEEDEDRLAELVRAADDEYAVMLGTAPTTLAGLAALVTYVEGSGQGGVRRDLPLGTQETDDGVTYEDLFLGALRRSLAQLSGEGRA